MTEFSFPHATDVEPAVIRFDVPTSSGDKSAPLHEWRQAAADEGRQLESVLRSILSGAHYDALFAAMAEHEASLLVIRHKP